METATGTLGVESNINASGDYTDSSGNGLDCHLEKNTEYGTITLLAASEFGNTTSTKTLNQSTADWGTGIYEMTSTDFWEFVANTYKETDSQTSYAIGEINDALLKADDRYVNRYTGTEQNYNSNGYVIAGDGLIETKEWGRFATSRWLSNEYPIFLRGHQYIFDYSYNIGNAGREYRQARAVVVNGAGL